MPYPHHDFPYPVAHKNVRLSRYPEGSGHIRVILIMCGLLAMLVSYGYSVMP